MCTQQGIFLFIGIFFISIHRKYGTCLYNYTMTRVYCIYTLEKCLHFPLVIWDLGLKGIISFSYIETRITGNSGAKGLECNWRPYRGKQLISGSRNLILAPGDKPNTILCKQRNEVEKQTWTVCRVKIIREQQRPPTHFQKSLREQSIEI